jgi:hypothetical protein
MRRKYKSRRIEVPDEGVVAEKFIDEKYDFCLKLIRVVSDKTRIYLHSYQSVTPENIRLGVHKNDASIGIITIRAINRYYEEQNLEKCIYVSENRDGLVMTASLGGHIIYSGDVVVNGNDEGLTQVDFYHAGRIENTLMEHIRRVAERTGPFSPVTPEHLWEVYMDILKRSKYWH